jgi:hypothetical protein
LVRFKVLGFRDTLGGSTPFGFAAPFVSLVGSLGGAVRDFLATGGGEVESSGEAGLFGGRLLLRGAGLAAGSVVGLADAARADRLGGMVGGAPVERVRQIKINLV